MFEKFRKLAVSKRAVTRLFTLAIAFVVAGGVTGSAIVIVGLANGAVAFGGSQLVTINPGPFVGAIVGLIFASLLTAIGSVAAIAAWVGALLNTSRLEDKKWFAAL